MSGTESTTTKLREEAAAVGEAVQQQAAEVKERGGRELRTQLSERTTRAGRTTRAFAQALRRSGTEFEAQQGDAAVARVTSALADGLDRAGGYLEQARGDEMLRDAEQLARRRPWLVAGVAAAAGFAASRFLKASSERRYGQSHAGTSARPSGEHVLPAATSASRAHPAH